MATNGKSRQASNGRYAHITGWGADVPERIMTNGEMEKLVNTSDQWIRERTGIRERRIADVKDTVVTLGVGAARKALDVANLLPTDIDMIIVATSSPAYFFPSTACQIQDRIGATQAGAFDVVAACSGFIFALGLAAGQIKSGAAEHALVIGTETLSRIIDWTDRGTCILFGDGAGAVVLQASDVPGGIREVVMHSDGSGGDLLYVSTGIRANWNDSRSLAQQIAMNGREVFRFASKVMASATEEVLEKANLSKDDVALIIPHQANIRIIQAAARGLNLPMDRFYVNLDKYGNTSAASIPIALVEAIQDDCLHSNDKVVMVGFGAGLTWGAVLIEWDVAPSPGGYMRDVFREGWYIVARMRSFILRLYRFFDALFSRQPADPSYGRLSRRDHRDIAKTRQPDSQEEEK